MSEGEYAEGEYAEGEYAEGEYAEGEYAEGEYAEGEYAEGEYAEGGSTEGGSTVVAEGEEDEDKDSDVGWFSAKDIKGPPRKAPPKRPEDLEKEIQERKETWTKKYDTNRNWDENVGEAVVIDEGNVKEVSIDDFSLSGTALEENYENFTNVARGTFSIVKKAKSKKNGQEVAIKIVNDQLAPELSEKELSNQIEILKQFNHPNLVKLVENFESKGTHFYVFDFQKGGEAIKRFASNKTGKWNEAMAQKIIKQTLTALDYIHKQNIIHLHVTHENILLKEDSDESDVVLGGFTLSRKEGDTESVRGGSVDYQSPEILQQTQIHTKSDMWSLGVLSFLLLTGKLPFHDNNRMKRNLKISKGTYTIDPSLSESSKKFVASLLIVNQNDRLSSAVALQHEFITSTASQNPLSNVRSLFSSIN